MDLIAELRGYLEIDKHALDDEIVKQPSLFYKASEAYAEAVAERDACKEELASIDAEIDAKVRRDLEFAEERITDKKVEKGVQANTKHGEAFDTYILAKTRADKLLALKEAFQQRGYMLRDLASLYVASYYEQTSIKGNNKTDNAAYKQQRERLADAREARNR